MLRFRSEPVWLGLSAHQVGALRVRRGAAVPLATVDVAAAPDSIAALLQAAGQLIELQALRGRTLHAVLSDRLVRYALLPFSAIHLDAQEERALCQARFGAIYGPMPDWPMQVETARYGRTRLACAVAPALAAGLAALYAAHGIRRGMIVPHFVARWNACASSFGRGAGMLAVVEPETLVLASVGTTGWHSVRAQFVATGADLVADLIERERLLQRIDAAVPVRLAGTAPRPPGLALALAGIGR